jgi:hypothetical protein
MLKQLTIKLCSSRIKSGKYNANIDWWVYIGSIMRTFNTFYDISVKEAEDLLREYDNCIKIERIQKIDIGCRNSNYRIESGKGQFLLRIFPQNSLDFKKEISVSKLFYGHVRIPRLILVY